MWAVLAVVVVVVVVVVAVNTATLVHDANELCRRRKETMETACVTLEDVQLKHGNMSVPNKLDACVGLGGTGLVFQVGSHAVKVNMPDYQHNVIDEAEMYAHLGNVDGLIPIVSSGTANNGLRAWLIMPLMCPLPMKLTEQQALVVGTRTRDALLTMHSKGVVHGDISLSNMLYDGEDLGTVVLCDLGHNNAHKCKCELQRHIFRLPELQGVEEVDDQLAQRSDLFALGCVLLDATSKIPWFKLVEHALMKRKLRATTATQKLIRDLLITSTT